MKSNEYLWIKVIPILILLSLILSACVPAGASPTQPAAPTSAAAQPTGTAPPAPTQINTSAPIPTQTSTAASAPVLSPTAAQASNTPPPVPTFTAATATAALMDAFTRLANAFPFQIDETDKGPAQTTSLTADYAAADRYHATWGVDTNPDPDQNETITIGTKTWWKIKGAWDPKPSGTQPQNNFWAYMPKATDVAYTGQDTVDGMPCNVFSFKLSVVKPGLYLLGTGQVRVGVSDWLPHVFDFKPGTNVTGPPTHQVYTYGIAVDIQQPVP